MKQFNIVKQDVILFECYHLPVNACFGKFHTTYKKFICMKQVLSKKHGLIEKPQFQTISEDIIYYIDNFKALKNYGAEDYVAYNIHVYDSKHDKWIDTNTRSHKKYYALGEFLERMFEKNNIKPSRKCVPWVDYNICPKTKKAQVHSDSIYNTSVGYALSRNVMTCHNVNRDGWAYSHSNKRTI